MLYWLDTEFIEQGPDYPIDPISIALVAKDGREYYAINNECKFENASDWVVFCQLFGTMMELPPSFPPCHLEPLEMISSMIVPCNVWIVDAPYS